MSVQPVFSAGALLMVMEIPKPAMSAAVIEKRTEGDATNATSPTEKNPIPIHAVTGRPKR